MLLSDALSRVRSFARRFILVTTVAISVVCGVLAVAFHRYLELTRSLLIEPALDREGVLGIVLVVLTPAFVFVLLALAIRRFAPRAVGANLARVRMAYNGEPTLIGPRSVAATFIATPISLGAGAPLGPEGPIVVVTSGFGAAASRWLGLPPKLVRGMIPVGVAAGISAVFNAPMTGVVFALEEIFGEANRGLLGGVLVGAVAAAVVERGLLGGTPILSAPFSTWHDARELLGFAVVGVVAGISTGLAIAAAHRLKRWWAARMPSMVMRAGAAGLLIGALGLIAPSILGVGYDSMSFWLHGGGTATQTGIAFGLKIIAFVLAISSGVLGGSFAPSLFIGTALGAAIGHTARDLFPAAGIDPKAYAIVGMGSAFAGMLRSPIAAVVIVVELTRDYELMVPVMLGVSLAVSISRRISRLSVVEQQMIDEGYVEGGEASDPLAHVTAADAMTAAPTTIPAEAPIAEANRTIGARRHRYYPVVDSEMRLLGVLTRDAIDAALAAGEGSRAARELMEQPRLVATSDEPVLEVVKRMQMHGADRCPVVDAGSSRCIVGFISPSDILRTRMRYSGSDEGEAFAFFE
ncbi:MAG TPA: chloride channel protein [Thermoanaerobaculia bacterium]|nr:chloride channel protein [Thermoanaerobaculia bacterium]